MQSSARKNTLHFQYQQAAPGQACVLHTLVASPTQSLPLFAGAGLLQVLVSVPPPQRFEHAPKSDHPPSSVLSPLMPSAAQSIGGRQCYDSPINNSHASNALNQKTNIIAHLRQHAYLHRLAYCMRRLHRQHNLCRHLQARGCCMFWYKSRHHKL